MDKVHGTAVPSPGTGVSTCKIVVVAMGTILTAVAVAERNGPRVSCPNYRQPPEDIGDRRNVHNFLSQKGLVDEF